VCISAYEQPRVSRGIRARAIPGLGFSDLGAPGPDSTRS